MKIEQKQWWAPVWKGLVMDAEAKHYRSMKSALWLYLYLLVNANRKTGILMRKIETVSLGMGVTRNTAQRWLNVLRKGGYIQTINTGRSLTIHVTRWKPIAGVGKIRQQKSDVSNFSSAKYATGPPAPSRANPLGTQALPGMAGAANETILKRNILNDPRRIDQKQAKPGLTRIGAGLSQEVLAQELARRLQDAAGINLYRDYSARYPEWLLRKVLAEVEALPPERITKGRGALFNYLVQDYAKRITNDPGH